MPIKQQVYLSVNLNISFYYKPFQLQATWWYDLNSFLQFGRPSIELVGIEWMK